MHTASRPGKFGFVVCSLEILGGPGAQLDFTAELLCCRTVVVLQKS